jgi:undecaprenyl pyrophosphate phosphatase UppP
MRRPARCLRAHMWCKSIAYNVSRVLRRAFPVMAIQKGISLPALQRLLGHAHAEVEQLFRQLPLISAALLAVGLLILRASRQDRSPPGPPLTGKQALLIGVVQSLCLPFRGFSR